MPKPNKPKLSPTDKRGLRLASGRDVELAFSATRAQLRQNRWITKGNIYANNCVRTLSKQQKRHVRPNYSHLSKYIAASAVLHCLDGWGYLGRAMACHSAGDSNVSRHMAYYAELRAAVSLMSIEGIGIFDRGHYVVQPGNTLYKLAERGTHQVTWLVLNHWAGLRRSFDLLGDIITPGNVPLNQWLATFGAGVNSRLIGEGWLDAWGFDLKKLSKDRDARNQVSYRPTHLLATPTLTAIETSEFIRNIWKLFEPVANSRFDMIDRHLLRLSIEKAYKAISGQAPEENPVDFHQRAEQMIMNTSPSGETDEYWIRFLTRQIDHSIPQPIAEATILSNVNSATHHLQVISRASILMRLATGACASLIRNTGLTRDDLRFWWSKLGIDLGLWDPINDPVQLVDLWADVDSAMVELDSWQNASTPTSSYFDWHHKSPLAILVLAECERIGLWGLGL
jgi:hypothetical protein